jgi:hypothetical protein
VDAALRAADQSGRRVAFNEADTARRASAFLDAFISLFVLISGGSLRGSDRAPHLQQLRLRLDYNVFVSPRAKEKLLASAQAKSHMPASDLVVPGALGS